MSAGNAIAAAKVFQRGTAASKAGGEIAMGLALGLVAGMGWKVGVWRGMVGVGRGGGRRQGGRARSASAAAQAHRARARPPTPPELPLVRAAQD